jgi:hypothetical protein
MFISSWLGWDAREGKQRRQTGEDPRQFVLLLVTDTDTGFSFCSHAHAHHGHCDLLRHWRSVERRDMAWDPNDNA